MTNMFKLSAFGVVPAGISPRGEVGLGSGARV